ncbi:hypothetical protein K443DRAFT_13682 [Laccaria amethystina LaAM-08-1]|uniref:Protein phosphatase n=1 Tax=Laccaria amethystina LaAM-08-1 TaxID=1095629 RepID=A0A0C9WI51_9AGAR|nr:hypothetical protein K443DRAFT_13682 [Laccaria amethystina LaAM-08-1]
MSRIHQRLFRPRSSSVSSSTQRTLYTSTTPILPSSATSRGIGPAPSSSPTRLPIDLKPSSDSSSHSQHAHAPFSLALAPPAGNSQQQLLLSPLAAHHHHHHHPSPYPLHPPSCKQPEQHPPTHRQKRPRLKYHLDVGAYGIPKRTPPLHRPLHTSPSPQPPLADDINLAVQVGEDAYFIRDNAMGIADGVGGWSRSNNSNIHPTPSALFAKRLMHNCVLELAVPPLLSASPLPPSTLPPNPNPNRNAWYWSDPWTPSPSPPPSSSSSRQQRSLEIELEDELEQLSQGIDVLQILERAYDNTLKSAQSPKTLNNNGHAQEEGGRQDETAGSSTALLAVLDHLPRYSDVASASASGGVENGPGTMKNYAAGSMSISFTTEEADKEMGYDAAIRIVHVGDCMGMLVRDEDIVWRTEEMWWNYNTPVQLGPQTPHLPPSTTAHTCIVPVKKDDILILASDGLSDNLWDEEVLDEVVRFRRGFLVDSQEVDGLKTEEEVALNTTTELDKALEPGTTTGGGVKRKTLAGMLSEALCSRARRVSERKSGSIPIPILRRTRETGGTGGTCVRLSSSTPIMEHDDDEIPFARRAREAGRRFTGGKKDDISVIVAVISPSRSLTSSPERKSPLSPADKS